MIDYTTQTRKQNESFRRASNLLDLEISGNQNRKSFPEIYNQPMRNRCEISYSSKRADSDDEKVLNDLNGIKNFKKVQK